MKYFSWQNETFETFHSFNEKMHVLCLGSGGEQWRFSSQENTSATANRLYLFLYSGKAFVICCIKIPTTSTFSKPLQHRGVSVCIIRVLSAERAVQVWTSHCRSQHWISAWCRVLSPQINSVTRGLFSPAWTPNGGSCNCSLCWTPRGVWERFPSHNCQAKAWIGQGVAWLGHRLSIHKAKIWVCRNLQEKVYAYRFM